MAEIYLCSHHWFYTRYFVWAPYICKWLKFVVHMITDIVSCSVYYVVICLNLGVLTIV